ncbi:MAG: GTPase Era [Pseudomonadota bacterium]
MHTVDHNNDECHEMSDENQSLRSGHVALLGRPNAGKSTLLNRLIGEHVAIVTHKPQTTRHRITGILNRAEGQAVLVDTPGLHRRRDHALNRHMNRVAAEALHGVDLVLLLIDARHQTEEDQLAARAAIQSGLPVLLVFNKIDELAGRDQLLPLTDHWKERVTPVAVHFISALKGDGIDDLIESVFQHLPEAEPMYPDDVYTSQSERFLAAEFVREQLLQNLHQEIPYGTTVVIESFEHKSSSYRIGARIVVAEKRHKGMVIGKQGQTLKRIGSRARTKMQETFDIAVHLDLQVVDEPNWMDREQTFARLGYER